MNTLSDAQLNILIASIIGDREITKLYPGSRWINNSYREQQKLYRVWKQSFLPDLLYITPKSKTLRSRSWHLQIYPLNELEVLKIHLNNAFKLNLTIGNRNDGHGHILRTTSVKYTLLYLEQINSIIISCPSMFYKTNWQYRLITEKERYKKLHPNYDVVTSDHNRFKVYDNKEVKKIIALKINGINDW